jgi:GTPase SAR1 family protein
MIKLKAFVFGDEECGKSELIKQLANPSYESPLDHIYRATKFPDFYVIKLGRDNIQIWENLSKVPVHIKDVTVGIYCIDLLIKITDERLLKIQEQLNEYKVLCPNAEFILVGTRSDMVLNKESLLRKQLDKLPFDTFIATSARQAQGSKELRNFLIAQAKEMNLILKTRNQFAKDSVLYTILDNLNKEAKRLKLADPAIEKLGAHVLSLLESIHETKQPEDIAQAIKTFTNNSRDDLQNKHHTLTALLKTFASALTVAAIAAMIGFAIGFALGAWTGPGAFFAAITLGSKSALYVVAGTTVSGFAAGGLFGYRFFSQPALGMVDQVAEQVAELSSKTI